MHLSFFKVSALSIQRWRHIAFAALICMGICPGIANATSIKSGPFEIEFRSERSVGGGPSMNPLQVYKHARYKLLHNGRSVNVGADSGNGSKRTWFAADFLEAHFLVSNGATVVLICTETGTYLVLDEGGKPIVQQLSDKPATRYQFLDSDAGQPGEQQGFNAGSTAEAMGRDLGKSGTLMLFPELNGILNLATLKFRTYGALKVHTWDDKTPSFDGYRFDESSIGQARVWWPSRQQYALVRYKYVNEAKLFAFELVDLKTDSAYLVPFDLNDTRLTALGDITPAWMDHYFNWNGEKLALRKNQKPLPWQGSLKAATYGHFAYDLQPITPGMPSVFMKFLVDRFGVMADPSQATADIITNLSIKGQSFTFSYYKKSNRIVLEGEYGSPEAMTLQIAQDFNRELMNERNQAFFTKLNPQGFSR